MPELPEVETIVRDLRPLVVGRRISQVTHLNPQVLRHPGPQEFCAAVSGQVVKGVARRGKFIHLELGSGELLVVHLGMSGTLILHSAEAPVGVHTHLRLLLGLDLELRYRDPRRFGRVVLGQEQQLISSGALPRLGAEPMVPAFPPPWVVEALRTSHRAVKAVLLDQGVIAGCGNIYADEACFMARVRPGRRSFRLTSVERGRLLRALPIVMREAIRHRGTSFSDYRDGFGARGGAFESLFVYGRSGYACVRCGSTLRQAQVAGRTTVYCMRCQR
ncbi:MAG: bifunctional DNA-formamidopyrimidine glycosylase/DNA-(apurinic or apyrimidinic site) lyase [Candidatus Dormibacteria bacterium]